MKTLILNPDFYKSAILLENKKRTFNTCIVCQKMLKIFNAQSTNEFKTVPNYRLWQPYQEALKLYYNCLLKVCKEIHGYHTKYEFMPIDIEKLQFPNLTDLTFKSHQAFCIDLSSELYYPKFKENKDFNGGILIWEYDIFKNGEMIHVAEDLNGVYNKEKLAKNIGDIDIKSYDLFEINKQNIEFFK